MPIRVKTARELAALLAPRPAYGWRQDGATLVLLLGWPPSLNHYYRRTKAGGLRVSDAGRQYRADVQAALAPGRPKVMKGRLAVDIDASQPDDGHTYDLDNQMKCLLDSLRLARVYRDDSQIDRLTITRRTACAGGKLTVRISPWEG